MASRISNVDPPPTDTKPASPTPESGAAPAKEPRLARIARRAHELYKARGTGPGDAVADWLQAEREIDAAE